MVPPPHSTAASLYSLLLLKTASAAAAARAKRSLFTSLLLDFPVSIALPLFFEPFSLSLSLFQLSFSLLTLAPSPALINQSLSSPAATPSATNRPCPGRKPSQNLAVVPPTASSSCQSALLPWLYADDVVDAAAAALMR